MHIFCDASSKAYAAVIYWRLTRADGRVLVSFVASKSRVSPLKPISIPRLELQAALLGARLAGAIQREHKDVQPAKRYFWTDSSTVLQWIRSDPRSYKPYVAHRLGEIDELTKSCEWRHVPTASNVADVATRDDAPPMEYSSAWFQGPLFLRLPEGQWPKDRKFKQMLDDAKNELVVNNLRQRYWILKLRPTVRTVASHCLFCRYRRAIPQPQRMSDLPEARLQHNRRPFSYSGVDFFGPLEVTVGRTRQKRYCMLFTCLTIRAVHIEMTENLSTDSTIMALRRMAARRGMPQVIMSDSGTNLRGADAELKRSLSELDQEAIREAGSIRGVEWRFIPPGAPEMGGAWERMIRTVKSSLKIILKERAPHTETLLTVLAEVESLVNSRPLTYVSNDPQYPEALTPNHFLIGSSSSLPQFGKYDNSDLNLKKRWRVAQRLTDMFWARWIKEYLPTLLPRQKWTTESRQLQVNDYVIIVEPNIECNCWRHGVVSATHAGRDGRVRIVDVRTRTGVLRRPVTRVALLAPQDSSAN
ncbi:uncharacterized protein LOC121737359 [Aricia agestis]|uniref:uncharacterized protein LOC121737359 n=1 Tax=Aricia agestis TaxID=91739 RepID=UPI001C204901|nr:uncharacterized protein LOC121737359 [Aricia agestis]